MVEQFFWSVLLLIIVTFASPSAFSASYYLQMQEFRSLLEIDKITAMIGVENFFFGVSNVPILLASFWQSINIWSTLGVLLLVLLILGMYVWWMHKKGKIYLESRRLHKSIAAMEIIFAFVLAFACITSLSQSAQVNIYSTVILFLLSFVCLLRFGRKIPLPVYFIIAIGIAYFI